MVQGYQADPGLTNHNSRVYNKVGAADRAQAQAFIDTWMWDTIAEQGLREILDNEKGRFTSDTIQLIEGFRNILRKGSLFAYLVSMTLRIVEIHRVLKPTGSFCLHCDPTASHYLKMLMDAVFGPRHFRNEIIWRRTTAHSSAKKFAPVHDTILYFARSDKPTWNEPRTAYDDAYLDKYYRFDDGDGHLYWRADLTGSGIRHGRSGLPWRGFDPSSISRHWIVPIEGLDHLDAAGRIYWPKGGRGWPQHKRYRDDLKGKTVPDIWDDIDRINPVGDERLGYPTQKPKALLERIINASSNKDDVVLDAYCGCGTTVAVAQDLRRQWIGIDITYQSISLILKRSEDAFGSDVLNTIALDGIPKDIASARALANKKDDRVRKEFEKWAVLTYSNNRATINQKKGADHGIDGTAYFRVSHTENERMVFQAKSGHVGEKDIRDLLGSMSQERAVLGIFITLQEPTASMKKAAHAAGSYHHGLMQRDYEKIQIVTIREMLEHGKRLDMPLTREVVKRAAPQNQARQLEL